ncbi:vanadium-dependent haloperoxidase [Abyssalbus ytuae]|uniref:Vanadium-dependent haloperoxidase n=1 Tax=Abyssalbus ytuae TaxID=2926907 RepID=A0A9E6ZP84_9FLAO|nr:vanadium-dependent haloperoxidase [Abyssalbus ytuae]UOB17990.1 vanadium-dependent haloperoxidase [Abyssalbus ytuae]
MLKTYSKISLIAFVFLIYSCKKETKKVVPKPLNCFENVDNKMVIDMNNLTYTIANDYDQFNSFTGVRALTLTHLAMHDIFNSMDKKYEQFHFKEQAKECIPPTVAGAECTRIILTNIYPEKKDTINAVCNKWVDLTTDMEKRAEGINLGRKAALAYIKLRKNDAHERQGEYEPVDKPGDYQYTPGTVWVWKPDFSLIQSFTLDSLSKFRSDNPPALTSEKYAIAYNEVMQLGEKNNESRTEEQNNVTGWWTNSAEHSLNEIGRYIATSKKLSAIETNRMFALINMTLFDVYLASFESKYHYNLWRPYTAIHEAENDGNEKTESSKKWEAQINYHPWPEYPSSLTSAITSGTEIFKTIYRTENPEIIIKSENKEKNFNSFDKMVEECIDSRVLNGLNFRFSGEEGSKQGKSIAKHVLENYLKPIR